MSNDLTVGAWLPNDWGRGFTDEEKTNIIESDLDLLLVPENHDQWDNRGQWKRTADDLDVALYVGLEDDGWIRGIFYDPATDTEFTYTKHSTAGKLAFEQDNWNPETALKTTDFRGAMVGTTICHDQYLAPFMRYEGLVGASLLVNLSARPVVPKKWGEVLQTRAIENSAYVVCTMHGAERDGTVKQGNKGHVFAFDPFGDPLTLTELRTGEERKLFESTADNIYTFAVDTDRSAAAQRTLTEQQERPPITRIQNSTSESTTLSEPRFSIQGDYSGLRITYEGESVDITDFESQGFTLGEEEFYLATIEAEEILKPERLYLDVLEVPEIEDKRLLTLNHWPELNSDYHRNVVEPVLRARCVEWASPAVSIAPNHMSAYQAWYAKNTSRMLPDEQGRFQFYLYAARGVSSALDPVDYCTESMLRVVDACEEQHISG